MRQLARPYACQDAPRQLRLLACQIAKEAQHKQLHAAHQLTAHSVLRQRLAGAKHLRTIMQDCTHGVRLLLNMQPERRLRGKLIAEKRCHVAHRTRNICIKVIS